MKRKGNCEVCGLVFETNQPQKRFCSKRCRWKFNGHKSARTEKTRERSKRYRQRNSEKIKAFKKRNRKKINSYARKWRWKNRLKENERHKKWKKDNPDYMPRYKREQRQRDNYLKLAASLQFLSEKIADDSSR